MRTDLRKTSPEKIPVYKKGLLLKIPAPSELCGNIRKLQWS
jgi:hypothetical protein